MKRTGRSNSKRRVPKDVASAPWTFDRHKLTVGRIATDAGSCVEINAVPMDKHGNSCVAMPATAMCLVYKRGREVVVKTDSGIVIKLDDLLAAMNQAATSLKAKPKLHPNLVKILRDAAKDSTSIAKQRGR